jgi:small subunit ribosomal protein S1
MGKGRWAGIERRYPRGCHVCARVTAITSYGCYVELEDGIEGLVRTGDEGLAEQLFHIGSDLDAVVVDVNENQQRIALGLVLERPS